MKKIAVLISNAGSGTNLQAIIDAIEQKKINASLEIVVSDASDAYGLERAKKHNIKTYIFDSKKDKLEDLLTKAYPVDFIVLTGWKKIITSETIKSGDSSSTNSKASSPSRALQTINLASPRIVPNTSK